MLRLLRAMARLAWTAMPRLREMLALRYHLVRLGNVAKSPRAAGARAKPHLLFVIEKWCDGRPDVGLSNSEHNLLGSLGASGLATYEAFHQDEYYRRYRRPFDTALQLKCLKSRPDLIVLAWPFTPAPGTLKQMRDRLHIPTVALWWDSVNHMAEAESFLPFVDLNVVVDSSSAYREKTHQPEKYLPMWSPQDPGLFHNPGLSRDIDVSFAGTMTGHPDRLAGISVLRQNGIDVYQAGGQRESALPPGEYARVHMRSRIALNFCYHPNGMAQLKGRVIEVTLCGAMLLETENAETARWFEPMVDYVPFTDEADLVEKARYFLAHESERAEIAARGHQKAKQKYSGEQFWKTLLGRALGARF